MAVTLACDGRNNGIAAAVLCLLGLIVLFYRRLTTARLQKSTNIGDFIVATLLLAQVDWD
ncbi:MAG: respiratory nitrate reductase subunit gamma [bacterium]|nr:respiratory nitrate reductase subunit gamma [bacterium]